jgi:O-antigen/teichoic acid export membrane protein
MAKVLSAGITVIFTLVITRLLPQNESGTFLFYLTIVLVIANISRFGVDKNIVKSLAGSDLNETEDENSKYLRYLYSHAIPIFIFSTLLSITLYLSTPLLNMIFKEFDLDKVAIGFFSIPFYTLCLLIANFYQIKNKAYVFILSLNFFQQSTTLVYVLIFWLVKNDITLNLVITSYFLGCLTSSLFVLIGAIQQGKRIKKVNFDINTFINSTKVSLPLFVVVIFNLIVNWSTQVILAMFNPPEELAIYTVCLRLVMLISFVLVAINSVTAPKYAKYFKQNDIDSVKKLYTFSLKITFLFALFVTIFYLVAGNILLTAFGESYKGASVYLYIMMAGQIFNVLCGSVAYILQMKGDYIKVMKANIYAGIISVVISYYLINLFGLYGATISYSLSIGILNLILLLYVIDIFKIKKTSSL